VQRDGVIRIGYAPEAPYAFLGAGGEVTGEAPEITKVVTARLGIARINWRLIRFEELIPELEAGNIDVIAAGLFVTPERAQRVLFSRPTFRVQQALLVAAGNPLRLDSYRALVAHPTARAALLAGSIEAPLVRLLGMPSRRRVAVPDSLTGRVAVETGLADALALSSPTIRWMAATSPSGRTEVAAPFEQVALAGPPRAAEGAFAFRRSDRRLQAAWDDVLRTYVGSTAHRELVAAFGFTADELPIPSPAR
jgi:polar amino acid transport system substrate-binding protein